MIPIRIEEPATIQKWGLPVDVLSKAIVVMDLEHHRQHQKLTFSATVIDETLADNATVIIAFKTPSGQTRLHLTIGFITLVGGDLELWEGPTWTTNTGTVTPIINHFRETTTRIATVLEDKTLTPVFSQTDNVLANVTGLNTGAAKSIEHLYAWGSIGKPLQGATAGRDERILKTDTQYAILFTADGGSNKAQIFADWYESEDK